MKRMAVITWRLRKKEMELLGVRSLITVFSLTYPLFFFSLFIFVNSYSGALSDSVCILISLFLISLFLISLFYQSRIFPPLLPFIFSLTFLSLSLCCHAHLSFTLLNIFFFLFPCLSLSHLLLLLSVVSQSDGGDLKVLWEVGASAESQLMACQNCIDNANEAQLSRGEL